MTVRRRKTFIQNVTRLDAFPKTSEECKVTSPARGTVSLFSFTMILILIYLEMRNFFSTKFVFKYSPDVDFTGKIRINLDITVAMPCRGIGADIVDTTSGQLLVTELSREDTMWQLDKQQQAHFDSMAELNMNLRENLHSIHDMLWRSGYLYQPTPKRSVSRSSEADACRITGSVKVNKVAGNFHISEGATVVMPGGHAHINFGIMTGQNVPANFSHRIDRFSFGDVTPGMVHPLEGDSIVANKERMSFQYFITVVPTYINMYGFRGDACQYSVTELAREINHSENSHGIPGIYFKYDMSALKVEVREQHQETFLRFITRLAAITGGVFTCSGILNRIAEFFVSCLPTSKAELPLSSSSSTSQSSSSNVSSASTSLLLSNPVLPSVTLPQQTTNGASFSKDSLVS